ncbi:MAG: hypothetical protein IID40_05470 [Planctomycetes bacterium]|nr:hypothetical protein [Planctomycetota bacterium]
MFFQRISNGWALAKQSFRVLMLDKELLLFPLFSGIACLAVIASFALPLLGSEWVQTIGDEQGAPGDPLAYLVLFLFYFCNYFVIVFFNSALIACAVIRFKGGDPTVADGFRASFSRLPQIVAWALVSATVGLILKIIESRSQRAGRFAAALLGSAWGIATYFVVPVLVVEKLGPGAAIKRSLSVLKNAWGETIVANFGIGFIVFLLMIACMGPALFGVFIGGTVAVTAGIVLSVLGVLLVSLVSSAVNAISLGALYLYASDGAVPAHFDNDFLSHAFVARR